MRAAAFSRHTSGRSARFTIRDEYEWFQLPILPKIGTKTSRHALLQRDKQLEEETMPVIILWGIPTLIVLAGGGYWLMHMH